MLPGMDSLSRIGLALATSLVSVMWVVLAPVSPAHALSTPPGSWSWPLAGAHVIERAYLPPLTPYSSGHRGVDMPAAAGTEVRSPDDGVVTFAGQVVDRGVLSISHGKYTSSFEPITAVVSQGEKVIRGQVIGIVSEGPHCHCLHVGARVQDRYLSPLALLSVIPRAVLLPW